MRTTTLPPTVARIAPDGFSVRPVEPADRPALEALGRRCSTESLHHRFFSPVKEIPAAHLAGVLGDDPNLDSVVAELPDGTIIALASLATGRDGSTELGVLVEDAWHHRGVATALIGRLVGRARRRGITQLVVMVESTRPGLLAALAPLGPSEHHLDGPTLDAVFSLA